MEENFKDIFCIPHDGRYIVYAPLHGVIVWANGKLVNLLHRANKGDVSAWQTLKQNNNDLLSLLGSSPEDRGFQGVQEISRFAPTEVTLFLTADCTLRCGYCYARGGERPNQLSWDTVTGVLQQIVTNVKASNANQMTVHFHGGGDVSAAWPLLLRTRKYIHEMERSHGFKARTSVGLNGMLDAEQRSWIIAHIDRATVSIDGPPEVQNKQRPRPDGGESFSYVDSTLRAFDRAGYPYGIRTTVTSESVEKLEDIAAFFCREYEAKRIKAEPMFPRGRADETGFHPPSAEAFVSHFRKARAIAREAGRELIYSGARLDALTNVFCRASGDSCAITPEGEITSCYEVVSRDDPLSDVFFYGHFDTRLGQMVVDEQRRKSLFDLDVLHKPFCDKCFCKWHCAGDCPVKAIHAERNPSPNLPDRCRINRELTKDQILEALES